MICIRIILFLLIINSFSLSSVIIVNDTDKKIESFPLLTLNDKSTAVDFETIKNTKFKRILNNPFTLSFEKGISWLQFTIQNNSNHDFIYIYFTESYFDIFDLYETNSQNTILHKNGIYMHLESKNTLNKNPTFKINIKKNTSKTIYIKLFSKLPKFGEIKIYTQHSLLLSDQTSVIIQYMFYFGGLFIIVIFNLFLFITIKEAIYGYYVGYTLAYIIFIASMTSFTLNLGLQNWYYELYSSTPILLAFLLLFSHSLLNIKHYSTAISKLIYLLVFLYTILTILIIVDIVTWYNIVVTIATLTFGLLFFSSFYVWMKGESDAKLYFFALSVYLVTMVLFTAMANGWIENNSINRYFFLYASFFEIIFFALMLANRFNKINTEKLLIQEKHIELKSTNEQILEEKVRSRTTELEATKEKLLALNSTLEHRVDRSIQEIREKEKILKEQSKLAQMGEMISMIAHQWRQPLGAVSSAVFGIQTKIATNKYDLNNKEEQKEFLAFLDKKHNNINEYIQFLSTTVDDFRNFFKPDKSKKLINITLPITRALHIVETSLESRNIHISTDFEIDTQLSLYQNEMMQVILNIIKNSEDNFMEKNTINPQINILTKKKENTYIISICDNGGGIKDEILDKIFEPYFSTKDDKNGTGLGLYMSKIIVEEHNNGKLIASNTPIGACFEIILK